jgi:putative transposase
MRMTQGVDEVRNENAISLAYSVQENSGMRRGDFADLTVLISSTSSTRRLASQHLALQNHMTDIVAVDMFVVGTATFQILYALIILGHDRRKVIHFEVTQNPTQVWLSRRMTEAFPWETAPRYLLPDRDKSYGPAFRDRVEAMGIEEVLTAPRSPWQNPFVERLIGSIRRECLDHLIIFNERHLRRVLSSYFQYHHRTRTHLSLDKDCPQPRPIQPPSAGKIVAFPEVGGLHHRYERRAA